MSYDLGGWYSGPRTFTGSRNLHHLLYRSRPWFQLQYNLLALAGIFYVCFYQYQLNCTETSPFGLSTWHCVPVSVLTCVPHQPAASRCKGVVPWFCSVRLFFQLPNINIFSSRPFPSYPQQIPLLLLLQNFLVSLLLNKLCLFMERTADVVKLQTSEWSTDYT